MLRFTQKKHPELYYEEKSSLTEYGYQPYGAPDVHRLAAGNSQCWPKPSGAAVFQKKTIILADWWASSWEDHVLIQVTQLFNELIDEEFSIHVWQQTEFLPLISGQDLSEEISREKIKPEFESVLYQKALQHLKLSHTKICLLQRPQLFALMGYSETYIRTIPFDYFNQTIETQHLKTLNQGESKHFFSHVSIYADTPDDIIATDRISSFKHRWPELTIWDVDAPFPDEIRREQISFILIDDHHIENQGTKYAHHDINSLLPKDLKFLQLEISISDISIFNLSFPHLSNLEHLTLNIAHVNTSNNQEKRGDFAKNAFKWIHQCLQSCSNIKYLSIVFNNYFYYTKENHPTIELPNLHAIKISHFPLHYLHSVLKLPSLYHLDVNNSSLKYISRTWPIKSLSLEDTSICEKIFFNWCKDCIYIQLKDIYHDEWSSDIEMHLLSLKALRIRQIAHEAINPLSKILNAAPALTTLTLECNENLDFTSIQLLDRKKLKYVSFENVGLNFLNHLPLRTLNRLEIKNLASWELSKEAIEAMNCVPQVSLSLTEQEVEEDQHEDIESLPHFMTLHALAINAVTLNGDCFKIIQKTLEGGTCLKYLSIENFQDFESLASTHPSLYQKMINLDYSCIKSQHVYQHDRHQSSSHASASYSLEPPNKRRRLAPSAEYTVDLTRDFSKQSYALDQIFYSLTEKQHPHPGSYRLKAYQEPKVILPNTPCTFKQADDLQLDARRQPTEHQDVYQIACQQKQAGHYYGKQTLNLDNHWQPIASLSAQETILYYTLTPKYPVEIQYSKRDNLYYIRTQSPQHLVAVTLEFILEIPSITSPILPENLKKNIQYFKNFKPGKLNLKTDANTSPQDYLINLIKQQVGACDLRALLFHAHVNSQYQSRIITNDCHAFIELYCDSRWITIDLGGYESKIEMKQKLPEALQDFSPLTQELIHFFQNHPNQRRTYDSMETYLQSLLSSPDQNILISIHHEQLQALHIAIEDYAKEKQYPIYYIHSPDDLVCSAPFVQKNQDHSGQVMPGPGGELHAFLSQINLDISILVVNYQQFKADDMVRCKALLDMNHRLASKINIPAQ